MEETVMSETEPGSAQASNPAPTPSPSDAPLGEGGVRVLEEERSARKELESLVAELGGMSKGEVRRFIQEARESKAKLAEIEAANLSDLEKAQKAAKDAADRLAEYETTTLKQRVALEKGLPAKWVDRLKGDSKAELEADADAILADIKPDTATPKPDRSQGGSGQPPALNSDGLEQALMSKLGIS